MTLKNLIKKGESKTLEFKETFWYNIETNQKDRKLKNEVSKAVCGMLNSEGGIILIGVADDKSIRGIERDLDLYGRGNESNKIDKLLIDLNDHITKTIDIKSKQFLDIEIIEIDGTKIIEIEIDPSNYPFFYSGDEIFYVRDGPRTIKLSKRIMGEYISDRVKLIESKCTSQKKILEVSIAPYVRAELKGRLLPDRYIDLGAVNKSVRPITVLSCGFLFVNEGIHVFRPEKSSSYVYMESPSSFPVKLHDGDACHGMIPANYLEDQMKKHGIKYPIVIQAFFDTNDDRFYSKTTSLKE